MEKPASTVTPASIVTPSVTISSAMTPSFAIPENAEQQEQPKEPPSIPPILNDRMDALTGMITNTSDQGEPRAFTCFQSLPCELRLQIWRHVLRRRRTIRIRGHRSTWLGDKRSIVPGSEFSKIAYTHVNSLGNKTSGQMYSIYADIRAGWESSRFPSALMAVNAEARQAALEFYYIQVPAADWLGYPRAGNPTIYINPEFDHIRILAITARHLVDLLWDMAAYDPKGKGIENWIVSPFDIRGLIAHNSGEFLGTSTPGRFIVHVTNPLSDWPVPDWKKMFTIVANIRTIMITHRDRDKSRLSLYQQRPFDFCHKRDPHQPIFAGSHDFDVLPADPRPGVSLSLTTLWVSDNPKVAYDNLVTLLGFFTVKPADVAKLDITHMISVRPEWNQYSDGVHANCIENHEDLVDLLRADAAAELKAREIAEEANDDAVSERGTELNDTPHEAQCARFQHFEHHDANASVAEQRASNEKLGLPPLDIPEPPPVERVAGFWLFPHEAFEDMKGTDGVGKNSMTRWNVSGSIPQLGVFRMPAKSSVR